MRPRSKLQKRRSIKIPKALFDRIDEVIEGAQFNSVTDFIVFVLRSIVAQSEPGKHAPGEDEIAETRRRLKKLGYL